MCKKENNQKQLYLELAQWSRQKGINIVYVDSEKVEHI
jgi:hypothetical protein